jgi:hypothetical protein
MKVLLHIGQSKTGTSAIQAFLTLNRNKLREIGVLYPAARVNGMPVNLGSHNAVADAVAGKPTFPYLTADQYFKQFFEEAERIDAKLLILSGEHFFAGEPRTWDVPDEEEYLKYYEQKVHNVAHYLTGHEVNILIYLRPQIDWLSSAISQAVRTDRLISNKQLYHNDRQFFGALKPLLKYSTLLDIWERVLKPQSLTAIPYDRGSLYKKSSIADFLMRAGLENTQFPYASENIQVNESLSREYLEVKKRLNEYSRSKNTERVIIRCLEQLSKSSTQGSRYLLDAEVRRDVEKFVTPENEQLNEKYRATGWKFLAQSESVKADLKPLSDELVTQAMRSFRNSYRRPRYKLLWINYATRSLLRSYATPLHAALHQVKMAYQNMKFRN